MYGNRQRPRGLSRGDVAVAFGRGVMMVVKASVRSRGPMEYSSSAPLPEAKCRKYCGLFLLVLAGVVWLRIEPFSLSPQAPDSVLGSMLSQSRRFRLGLPPTILDRSMRTDHIQMCNVMCVRALS